MNAAIRFRVTAVDAAGGGRAGRLETPHGPAATPAFMAVGTQAAVKTVDAEELRAAGCEIILANAYHLALRPGAERVARLGGLHRFMGWEGPLLTDSGGYQLFSLAPLVKVSDEGIEFQSHLDGARMFLTPEGAVKVQEALGPDILMVLDEPLGFPHTRLEAEGAMRRTLDWARRARRVHERADQALFAIVQGGAFVDLRRRCAEELAALDFPGYAVGGLCLGEGKRDTESLLAAAVDALPADRPRYVMGMGTPADLIRGVAGGADMFDCVMPTRHARRGNLFTWAGRLAIKNAVHQEDPAPIDAGCGCSTCRRGFSRAYLRHLYTAGEPLAQRLMTVHNLFFYQDLMRRMRAAIEEGKFSAWAKETLEGPLGQDPEGPPGGGAPARRGLRRFPEAANGG